MALSDVATLADQIAEVKREVEYRRRVYPRMIAESKMTTRDAELKSMRMLAVLLTLEKLRDDHLDRAGRMP